MKTISIKGKLYVPVVERLKEFRKDYDNGKIVTEIIYVDEKYCVMKASVFLQEELLAVGHACEIQGEGVNKTSYVENCETSAIGRALAMLGIGVIDDIASGDEVALARDPDPEQIDYINKLIETSSLDPEQRKRVEDSIFDLTFARAEKAIEWLQDNQLDKIDAGLNYNQGDIKKKI